MNRPLVDEGENNRFLFRKCHAFYFQGCTRPSDELGSSTLNVDCFVNPRAADTEVIGAAAAKTLAPADTRTRILLPSPLPEASAQMWKKGIVFANWQKVCWPYPEGALYRSRT